MVARKCSTETASRPLPALRFDIAEAAQILRMSRAQLYNRICEGTIRPQKDGARTYITQAELERYVDSCNVIPTKVGQRSNGICTPAALVTTQTDPGTVNNNLQPLPSVMSHKATSLGHGQGSSARVLPDPAGGHYPQDAPSRAT